MSLNKKLKIEREEGEESLGGSLVTTWVLGGLFVGACLLGKSCENNKLQEENKQNYKKMENSYQKTSSYLIQEKNIKYFNDKI